mmetsp:Transcript_4009/g.4443  ORF Transcript_4009/g.4443 Transcript_4009/m.4443 type:complete len:247 (-) Transcript_4009:271-1011(-)
MYTLSWVHRKLYILDVCPLFHEISLYVPTTPSYTSMLNRDYTNIRHPQPYQLTLPSFNELLTSIPLPTDFTQYPKGAIPVPANIHPHPLSSAMGTGVSPMGGSAAPHSIGGVHGTQSSPNSTLSSHLVHAGQIAPIPPSLHRPAQDLSCAPYAHSTVIDQFKIPTPPLSAYSFKESRMKDKRKHTCKVCLRSFTTSGHLARHNRIHTGERKHFCPWPSCDARFARQDNCMQHYKTHKNGKKRTKKF